MVNHVQDPKQQMVEVNAPSHRPNMWRAKAAAPVQADTSGIYKDPDTQLDTGGDADDVDDVEDEESETAQPDRRIYEDEHPDTIGLSNKQYRNYLGHSIAENREAI